MALVVKDRVQETSTTTGTGTFTLAGAVTGFQAFSVIGDGNTTYYAIVGGAEFEVGLGTYTLSGTTLSRTTILESSNGGSAVNFSAGTKNVFVTYPAEKGIYLDASGNSIGLGTLASATLTNATGLPISTGVSGLGSGIATFLATPSSANLASAVTDETGSGSLVFATSPTLVTPALGTPSSGTLTNCTFPTLNQNTTGSSATVTGNATGSTFGFNSGYGSVVTAYGCRAWVNFNGTGTPAIRASGNVSSITDNGTGDYTVNFTTSMPDANYSPIATLKPTSGATSTNGKVVNIRYDTNLATGSCRVFCNSTGGSEDMDIVSVSIFR